MPFRWQEVDNIIFQLLMNWGPFVKKTDCFRVFITVFPKNSITIFAFSISKNRRDRQKLISDSEIASKIHQLNFFLNVHFYAVTRLSVPKLTKCSSILTFQLMILATLGIF